MKEINQIPEWNHSFIDMPFLGEEPSIHETATIVNSRIGSWTEIGPFAEIIDCEIGDYSYVAGVHAALFNTTVGKFCSIASSVRINPVQHPMDRVTQHHCTYRRKQYGFDKIDDEELFEGRKKNKVEIGADVWIGHGAVIMPGIKIATGSVIGSGAVVTKDIGPYEIAAGVPAKPIRKRFEENICRKLLASEWWQWPHEKIKENFGELFNISEFVKKILKTPKAN